MDTAISGNEDLDFWFQRLVVGRGSRCAGGARAHTAGWEDIPMELLLRIVSLLDDRAPVVAAGVCTAWRDAICFGLTRLSLSWCKNYMNDLLLSLSPKLTKLKVLILRQSRPQLQDDAVEAVASYCHDLRELDLSGCVKLSDRSLRALAHGCPLLSKLNISGCSAFGDSSLSYLSSFCRSLRSLNLCGCARAASDSALQAIAENCDQMEYLNLGWCEDVTDKGVVALAMGCPDLRALDLCGCVLITDESVVALAKWCPRLRSLDLYYCRNLTDRSMYSLARSQVIMSTKCSRPWGSEVDAATTTAGEEVRSRGLMSLNISQCTALTPPAVQAVCDSSPDLHTCPGRHSLTISGCLSLASVRCACGGQPRGRAGSGGTQLSNYAY